MTPSEAVEFSRFLRRNSSIRPSSIIVHALGLILEQLVGEATAKRNVKTILIRLTLRRELPCKGNFTITTLHTRLFHKSQQNDDYFQEKGSTYEDSLKIRSLVIFIHYLLNDYYCFMINFLGLLGRAGKAATNTAKPQTSKAPPNAERRQQTHLLFLVAKPNIKSQASLGSLLSNY